MRVYQDREAYNKVITRRGAERATDYSRKKLGCEPGKRASKQNLGERL
jgi:hypothetical protein